MNPPSPHIRPLHPRSALRAALALAIALLAALPAPAQAKQTHLFLETFGSVAQPAFEGSNSLALDRSTGDLLVIDSVAKTLTRWKPNGEADPFSALGTNLIDATGSGPPCSPPSAQCDGTPQNGFKMGSFPGEVQVAVDNSGTITDGDIYVTQGEAHLVDVFSETGEYLGQLTAAGVTAFGQGSPPFGPCGATVDEAGNLYLGGGFDDKIYRFDPSANPPLNADGITLATASQTVCTLAAGAGPSAGTLFADTFFSNEEESLLRYGASSGALESVLDPREDRAIAVDPASGHVFAIGGVYLTFEHSHLEQVEGRELTASGSVVTTFAPGSVYRGIAIDPAVGRLYLSSFQDSDGGGGAASIRVYGPTATIPDLATGSYQVTGDTSVRIEGTVNPDGQALEDCDFQWGPTATPYEHPAEPCAEYESGGSWHPLASLSELGEGHAPVPVRTELIGLAAEASYHYRLLADNHNHVLYPQADEAIVKGADRVLHTPAKPAIEGLWAEDTLLTDATLKATLNPENSPTSYRFEWGLTGSPYEHITPEVAIGSGDEGHTVSLRLSGLAPATAYHYRLVAENTIGISAALEHVFTTFAPAAPQSCANASFRLGPATNLPDCRAYELVSPVDKEGGDIRVLRRELGKLMVLEQASESGDKLAYGSLRSFGGAASAPFTSQYIARRIAGAEWQTHPIDVPRGKPVSSVLKQFHSEFEAFSPDLCQAWVGTYAEMPAAPPGFQPGVRNLLRRGDGLCGPERLEALAPLTEPKGHSSASPFEFELQGVSADGAHAILAANSKLTKKGGKEGAIQLYESVGGALRFVCFLPGGAPFEGACTAGTSSPTAYPRANPGSISADGRRVFFSTGGNGPRPLYVRIDGKETKPVSQAAEAAEGIVGSEFWGASLDGSTAVFSVGQVVTGTGDAGANARLYSHDVDTEADTKIAGEVLGVLGVSEDAKRVYFASKQVIGGSGKNSFGAEAIPGQPNLYLYKAGGGGTTSFVATLAGADLLAAVADEFYLKRTARLTPDGGAALFVSTAPLSGYDNVEARPSACGPPESLAADRCQEVYRYDAATGTLDCLSCDPTGARPQGLAGVPPYQTPMHAPRVISDDGSRVFFESGDRLAARDSNGAVDVYQWEQAGTGGCAVSSYDYSVSDGGCVSLISSGQSPLDSRLVESSPDGRDAFFATGSGLLPQDPGLFDIYDARVGGGLPVPAGSEPSCEGEACQSPPAPPDDPTPASSAFQGAGNVVQAPAKKTKHHKKHHRRRRLTANHNRGGAK